MSKRRYGKWAANPNGDAEDVTQCVQGVSPQWCRWLTLQCSRKRGHGPDGLYCRQHATLRKRDGSE